MLQVGAARFRDGVEIDVDDIVQHPHRGRDRPLQPRVVDAALAHMVEQVDRPEIADRNLVVRRIQRDLGAEIR